MWMDLRFSEQSSGFRLSLNEMDMNQPANRSILGMN